MSQLVLLPDSELHKTFKAFAQSKRVVLLTGLPGVGKSLLLQQLALLAQQAGRRVHLLQWDVSRRAFETDAVLSRYPEIDGVTQPIIRLAAGMLTRRTIAEWDQTFYDSAEILIGELPLVGNRLIEVAQSHDDAAEQLLASDSTVYCTPVPSRAVRAHIEAARAQSIASPNHERERFDAPPNVLTGNWIDLYVAAHDLGIIEHIATGDEPYDPAVYAGVFNHVLSHRNHVVLEINDILRPAGSVYDLENVVGELSATEEEAAALIDKIEREWDSAEILTHVNNWHKQP